MRSFFSANMKRILLIFTIIMMLLQSACVFEPEPAGEASSSVTPTGTGSLADELQPDESDGGASPPEQIERPDETDSPTGQNIRQDGLADSAEYVDPLSDYAFSNLPDGAKELYGSVAYTMETHSEGFMFDAIDVDMLKLAISAVKSDHPEYFWVSGYTLRMQTVEDELVSVEYVPEYMFTAGEAASLKPEVEAEIAGYLRLVEGEEDEYGRALILFNELVVRCTYGASENDQNIVSVFTQRVSVCSGYAKALQLLYIRAGIRCAYVTGEIVGGERHAWNIAVIDGEPYCMDATWSDARPFEDGTEQTKAAFAYFALTTEEMLRSRVRDEGQNLPVCMATEANYYIKNGLVLDGYDSGALTSVFTDAALAREARVSFKFTGPGAYNEAIRELFEENRVFDILGAAASVQGSLSSTRTVYSLLDDLYIICVELQYG